MNLLLVLVLLGTPVDDRSRASSAVSASGEISSDLDMAGHLVGDSTDAVELGTACTGGATGDVCTGGDLHAEGDQYLTGDLQLSAPGAAQLIYKVGRSADAAGSDIIEHAGHAFGTSKDGGDLVLCGGDASHSIATTAAIAAGDSVAIYIDGVLVDTLVEGVAADFDCSGTDDTCAASLCTEINAQSGVSCSGTTSPINPQVDADKCTVSFAFADGAADGVVGVDTTGARGAVLLGPGSAANPALASFADYRDGMRFVDNAVYFAFNGSDYFILGTSGFTFGNNRISATGYILNSSAVFWFGSSSWTSSHSLGAGDVGFAYDIEIDGVLYADGPVAYSGTSANELWDSVTITTSTSAVPPANAPDLDAFPAGGVTVARCYPDGSDTYLYGQWHAPPGYADGTDVIVEVYWAADGVNTGNVDWEFAYSECTPGAACAANTTVSVQDAGPGTANDTQSVTVTTITGTTLVDDSNIVFRLMRDGNDGVNDTLTDDACLMAVEIYFQRDAPGKFAASP